MTPQTSVNRRSVLAAAGVGALGVAVAACSGSGLGPGDDTPADPPVTLTFTPALDAEPATPTAEFSVKATDGSLNPDVKLTNPRGVVVKGQLSEDRTTYTISEPLGYGTEYTWSGTAVGLDRKVVPVAGTFTTLQPSSQVNVVVNIGDGQEVGIAAPIILKFNGTVEDKEAVERALTVTTTPPTEGSWAWLGEDNGSRVHWRACSTWSRNAGRANHSP